MVTVRTYVFTVKVVVRVNVVLVTVWSLSLGAEYIGRTLDGMRGRRVDETRLRLQQGRLRNGERPAVGTASSDHER